MRHGKHPFILTFLLPPLALYGVFVISPYLQAFQISLTDWRGLSPAYRFVGLENFGRLLHDRYVWNALKDNAILLAALPVTTIALGLFFASMLNVGGRRSGAGVRGVLGSGVYRIVYFFPQVLSVAIIGVLWREMYAPNSGLVNGMLRVVGLGSLARPWLGDPSLAFWCVLVVLIWSNVGFYVVLFSAGMQSIPRDIYEAALLDGASRPSSEEAMRDGNHRGRADHHRRPPGRAGTGSRTRPASPPGDRRRQRVLPPVPDGLGAAHHISVGVGSAELFQDRRADPHRPVGVAVRTALGKLGPRLEPGAHRPVLPQQRYRGHRLAHLDHAARGDGGVRTGPLRVPRQPDRVLPLRGRDDVPGLSRPGTALLRGPGPRPARDAARPDAGVRSVLPAVHGLLPDRVLPDAAHLGRRGGAGRRMLALRPVLPGHAAHGPPRSDQRRHLQLPRSVEPVRAADRADAGSGRGEEVGARAGADRARRPRGIPR